MENLTLNKNVTDINNMMTILRESVRHFISKMLMETTMNCNLILGEDEAQGLSTLQMPTINKIFEDNEGIIWLQFEGTQEPTELDEFPIETQIEIINKLWT
jgi:hypothetical protein